MHNQHHLAWWGWLVISAICLLVSAGCLAEAERREASMGELLTGVGLLAGFVMLIAGVIGVIRLVKGI